MKPILDRTKSKAEAYAPAQHRGTPFDARFGHERSLLPTAFSNRIYVVSIKATICALGQ
jgi:hypothetical protein